MPKTNAVSKSNIQFIISSSLTVEPDGDKSEGNLSRFAFCFRQLTSL